MIDLQHCEWELRADASRVVLRPFTVSSDLSRLKGRTSRTERIIKAVLARSEAECRAELDEVDRDFDGRHWQTHAIFQNRFEQVRRQVDDFDLDGVSPDRAKLIGAYFSHEYSYAAAAVMNPSIVPHPDQTGARDGAVRFIMSLRTVGEGHISTISFREGFANTNGTSTLWPQQPFALAAAPDDPSIETGAVTLRRHESANISGAVLFPTTHAQANGLEDLRLVQFTEEDGRQTYMGTYTAYSGREISSELLVTERFQDFAMQPLRGAASKYKGLAIFPRRIDGRYAAIGRLDHESLFFMRSDDRLDWNDGQKILEPKYSWELIQTGNCGSPIETADGWILLTHGVGAMRQYSIGAVLLDAKNPAKVIGRTREPILRPIDETREGYVPNVVYTCGMMRVGDRLFIPYAVADSSVRCVSVSISDIVAAMR